MGLFFYMLTAASCIQARDLFTSNDEGYVCCRVLGGGQHPNWRELAQYGLFSLTSCRGTMTQLDRGNLEKTQALEMENPGYIEKMKNICLEKINEALEISYVFDGFVKNLKDTIQKGGRPNGEMCAKADGSYHLGESYYRKKILEEKKINEKFCKGNYSRKNLTGIYEILSSRLITNPEKIKFVRFEWDCTCSAIFYTEKGTIKRDVNFSEDGTMSPMFAW